MAGPGLSSDETRREGTCLFYPYRIENPTKGSGNGRYMLKASTRGLGQMDLSEMEAGLVYITSFKPGRAM